MGEARRTFGPLVLLGGGSAALAAVAGDKPWAAPAETTGDPLGLIAEAGSMPLAAALSLVVLACWGVLLVTRARVRRWVAVLATVAALGLVATVVAGAGSVTDQVAAALETAAVSDGDPGLTGWFWTAAVASVLTVLTSAAAVRFAPAWPEMGSRYDAPGEGAPATATTDDDASHLDLWKAMDEGRDPTA